MLAEDVKHSFAMLSGKGASPAYQTLVAGLMPVFSRKWGVGKTMDNIVTDYPITTGPYLIDKVDMPRRIEFKRNPDYWGKALPMRRGHFHFERVVYRNYSDNLIALEAFNPAARGAGA